MIVTIDSRRCIWHDDTEYIDTNQCKGLPMDSHHMLIAQARFAGYDRNVAPRHECCAPVPSSRASGLGRVGRLGIDRKESGQSPCCEA
jgi:hypothetical protein